MVRGNVEVRDGNGINPLGPSGFGRCVGCYPFYPNSVALFAVLRSKTGSFVIHMVLL